MLYLAQRWACSAFQWPLLMWNTRGQWNLMQSLTKDLQQCSCKTAFQYKFPFCLSVMIQVETNQASYFNNMIELLTQPLKRPKGDKTKEAPRGGCRSPGAGVWGWTEAGLSLFSFGNTLLPLRWGQSSSLLLQHSSAPCWRNPMVHQLPKYKSLLEELRSHKLQGGAKRIRRRRKDSLLMRECVENKK